MRIIFPKGPGKKVKTLAPNAADRVHFYIKGQLKAIAGYGPSAEGHLVDLPLPAGKDVALVALIDNLGRYGGGNNMSEGKGLAAHLHEVSPKRLQKPKAVLGTPRSLFENRHYIEGMHGSAVTSGRDYVWTFEHRSKAPLILEIKGALTPAEVLLNEQRLAFYPGHTGRPLLHLVIDESMHLKRGKNQLRLAPMVPAEQSDLAKAVALYESKSLLTDRAVWAFAKWEQPRPNLFKPLDRARIKALAGKPAWYRATFIAHTGERALWFEPGTLSKGQIYLNGINVGRYFNTTPEGKAVGPQKRYYLSEAWLRTGNGETNEIVIFDEHGADPSKGQLVHADSAFHG